MVLAADGRNARRHANREAVLDALLAYLDEGVLGPSVEDLIQRAGVSERSLFRYFEGLDDLRSAAIAHAFKDVMHLLEMPKDTDAPRATRIKNLVRDRLALFEAIAGVARLARSRELEFEETRVRVQQFREQLRAQAAAQFGPEINRLTKADGERLVTALTVMLSFESWDMQRRAFHLSEAKVRATWIDSVGALLAAHDPKA